jgi:hypothetical protein
VNSNDAVTKVLEQVTRWDSPSSCTLPETDGDLVLYDDAIWAARQAFLEGQRDMLAKCIAAVQSIHSPVTYNEYLTYCKGCADTNDDEWSFAWPCPVVNAVRALLEGEK